jgi:hypothetical protein
MTIAFEQYDIRKYAWINNIGKSHEFEIKFNDILDKLRFKDASLECILKIEKFDNNNYDMVEKAISA